MRIDTGAIRDAQRQLDQQIAVVEQIEGSEVRVAGMLEESQRLRTLALLGKISRPAGPGETRLSRPGKFLRDSPRGALHCPERDNSA